MNVNGKSVLVVDDDVWIRKIIQICLSKLGYSLVAADSGRAAINVLAETKVELIILDMTMPDMDGLTFLDWLHTNVDHPRPPVLVSTLLRPEKITDRALQAGATDIIFKPYNLAALSDKVMGCLNAGSKQ